MAPGLKRSLVKGITCGKRKADQTDVLEKEVNE